VIYFLAFLVIQERRQFSHPGIIVQFGCPGQEVVGKEGGMDLGPLPVDEHLNVGGVLTKRHFS